MITLSAAVCREQGWRSGESARLHHINVVRVRFQPGAISGLSLFLVLASGFPPSTKTNTQIPVGPGQRTRVGTSEG